MIREGEMARLGVFMARMAFSLVGFGIGWLLASVAMAGDTATVQDNPFAALVVPPQELPILRELDQNSNIVGTIRPSPFLPQYDLYDRNYNRVGRVYNNPFLPEMRVEFFNEKR